MPHRGPLLAALAGLLALAAAAIPAAAQPAACLAPAAIADADVTRNAEALADPVLCLSERFVADAGGPWHLVVVTNTETPGPLWAVPHDEEDEAFDAGVRAVRLYGGTMIAVENADARLVGGRDPNQHFALTAEAAAPCLATGGASPAYVGAFLADWDRRFPIVGLHANWDGYRDAGGLGDISVRRPDVKMIPFPSAAATGRLADEDTIVMLVSRTLPEENPAGRAAIDWFNERGVHVIYRHVTPQNNGCTLADYLTLNAVGPYVSIEVEHGDPDTADTLVDIVVEYLRRPDFPGML
ncbi:MAG: hypothetical protein IT534_12790 [Bauldia sp.]|nr:hypothetical protein [Bauldia sp.]